MIRVRTLALTALLLAGCLAVAACNKAGTTPESGTPDAQAPVNIGGNLYARAPMAKVQTSDPRPEPIVIPDAVVQMDQLTQVSSQVDTQIELIATPLADGEQAPANDPRIVYHPRDAKNPRTPYRILSENDTVKKGQILVRLDEQLVAKQIDMNSNLVAANQKIMVENQVAVKSYEEQLAKMKDITVASSKFELLQLEGTVARLKAELISAEREKVKAQGDKELAQVQLNRFWLYSPINGRIVKLMKKPGEFVKAGETVLEIQATDRVRVEGRLDVQYAAQVQRGMKVIVEPARPVGPSPLANYHRQEVTSIAVTADPKRPLIVSGGLDDSALVWDVTATKRSHRLPHPAGVGVRTLAATGKDSKAGRQLVATGGADGKVRLWDVTDADKLPSEPLHVFDEAHASAVTSSAFSPDGRYLATAANRDVTVWSVADKKKLYSLPAEHSDAITCVRFTPQCTLVTAARDRTIRVWKLGDQGAATSMSIAHRSGNVDVLGMSADGSKILFDKDANRLDIVSLADERSIGTLQTPGTNARFSTLAQFSSDDKLILTASADGALTVWEAPQAGGRGAERVRLVTPYNSLTTCAAISTSPEKKFLAVGTNTGGVYFWESAVQGEAAKPMTGEVVAVLPADARSVQVRVEMANPLDQSGEGLQDRSLATIIIYPGDAAPTAAPARVVAAPAPEAPIRRATADATDTSKVTTASATLPVPAVPMLPQNAIVVPALPSPNTPVVPPQPNPQP